MKKTSGCTTGIAVVTVIVVFILAAGSCSDEKGLAPSGGQGSQAKGVKPAAPKTVAKTGTEAPAVSLPVRWKPSEPDWNSRRAYWEQQYDAKHTAPAVGETLDFRMANGASRRGRLVELEADTVRIRSLTADAEITLQAGQLDADSQKSIWPARRRDAYAAEQIRKERTEYLIRLVSSYDEALREVDAIEKQCEDAVSASARAIAGKVSQVVGSGVLLYEQGAENPLYIEGIGDSLVDGDYWKGTVFFDGTAEYVTVLGAPKKVRKYGVIPPAHLAGVISKYRHVQGERAKIIEEKTRETSRHHKALGI